MNKRKSRPPETHGVKLRHGEIGITIVWQISQAVITKHVRRNVKRYVVLT